MDEANDCLIDFEPLGCRVRCAKGTTILAAACSAGLALTSVCGGEGTCGQCKVRVVTGSVSPATATERDRLGESLIAEGVRMACLTSIQSDVKIDVPRTSRAAAQRLELDGLDVETALQPAVRTHRVTVDAATVRDPRSDLTLLKAKLAEITGATPLRCDWTVLQRLPGHLRQGQGSVAVCVRGDEIVDIAPQDRRSLGLAVDIGTTKIAAYIADLETGHPVTVDGITNPQIAYGEDVMSRISYAMKGGADCLRNALIGGLNELIERMCDDPTAIVDAVVVGNTVMHHIFLGLPLRQLGLAPYTAVVSDPVDVKARDLGLGIAPGAYVHLLPNVAGFVGADHVAMIVATGLDREAGTVIALDIGTNTEVVLAHNGSLWSCSTASGPAFEGAHIEFGMRAVDGAIDRVRLGGGVDSPSLDGGAIDRISLDDGAAHVHTIGESPAIGLCGSGVLMAVNELRRHGYLDRRGHLLDGSHVRERDGHRQFVLVPAERGGIERDITLSERDVSEILLAKGAIRTGIDALLREAGCTADALDGIVIAGAFGTHIDVASAMDIGMLPRIPVDRVRQVGNAAGVGARLALIDASQRERAVAIAERVQYVELMVQADFATCFARAMFLP